ncbi:rod shape-determining protein [Streptomyces griseosporeus]|uniref:rod shape-determining protein n=1 Tax=Streptomyces griseosporeus TaxID=1910 RepID=UPI0036C82977
MTGTPAPRTTPAHRPWPLCRRCCGIALDLGSARTRAWITGSGVVVDVPTVTGTGTGTGSRIGTGTGALYPVRRGAIVDTPGCARMLRRLLAHRLPGPGHPLIVVTAPALGGLAYRTQARIAVEALRPRGVLTVPSARAVAVAAGADMSRPLLVADIGAHLTEVVLLHEGAVTDARRTALGTGDLDATTPPERLSEAVAVMLTAMLRQDRTALTADALARGVLLAGGGALRPEVTGRLAGLLRTPLSVVPAPHTAAVRGAARLLQVAHTHPSASGALPPAADLH